MPSKRQPSKQRRAAQNRAQRAAREARRERAGELSAAAESRSASEETSSGTSGSTGGRSGGFLATLLGGGGGGRGGGGGGGAGRGSAADAAAVGVPSPAPSNAKLIGGGMVALDREGKPLPGARAAFVAVVLVIVGALGMMFLPINEVDDRGEVVAPSGQFRGLYIEVRELLNPGAAPLETDSISLLELVGPASLLFALVPLAVVVGAYWMHRRMGRSLPLTVGMLVLAVMFMLLGSFGAGMFFIPALISLAIGSFQARRVELPARMAERAARRGEAPADETAEDDEDFDDDLDDEDYEDDDDDIVDDEDFSTEDDDEAEEAEEEGSGFASDKRK